MVGKIRVSNIKLYAYHGCIDEEAIIGSWYRVDTEIEADLTKSSTTDQLSDTVDYVHLNSIVKEEMAVRSKLLERVAYRILERILSELKMVDTATVGIAKINPPVVGNVKEVAVLLTKERFR